MQFLTWRQADLPGIILAGLAAGYVMALFGLWAGSIRGLAAVDIADFGRRYMVSDRPSAWLFGLAAHLTNSVLLVLAWAMVIQPSFPLPLLLSGLLWGLFLAVTFAGVLVAPLAGLGLFALKRAGGRFALTGLLMHALWGLLIGLLYVPL